MPPRIAVICHLVLAVITIGAVTALAWHGVVPASSALLVITSASGLSILGTTTTQAQSNPGQTTERVTTVLPPQAAGGQPPAQHTGQG